MKKISTLFCALLMLLPFSAAGQTLSCDVNGDNEVNIADVNEVIKVILDFPVAFDETCADVNRDGEVNIADVNTIIHWIQEGPFVNESTCADVIAGPVGEIYRVKGRVDRIINTIYGNWYLVDETGEIYIYGTLDANGLSKNFLSLGIEEGDIVTVEGPKGVYNGLVELIDVTVLNIVKCPIKILGFDPQDATIPMTGGNLTVNLFCGTSNGVSVDIPVEASNWLSVVSITDGYEPVVTLHASANPGDERSAMVTFKTTDNNGSEYALRATIYQKGSIVDATVAEFIDGGLGDMQYRITGVLQRLYVDNEEINGFYIRDYSGEALVYLPENFTGVEAKESDIITVVGTRGVENESPIMVSGVLEGITPVTPVTVSEFLEKEEDPNTYYMLTGIINEIANPTYGNLYLEDETNRVYVYGCYPGWGATGDNRKNWLETAGIEVGDELSVIGVKSVYRETPQLYNGIYFSHKKPQ